MTSTTLKQTDEAIAELKSFLGERASTALSDRDLHSNGEAYHAAAQPDVVCYPRSTEEVQQIVQVSSKYKLPVVPFGAGTSLEGQVNAIHGGITIDLREMNKVLRISAEDLDATVEPGVTRLQLIKALKNTGLTFFIDPGADATLGGMASTRASGTTAVRYGTMRENVLGLSVVLADGSVIKTGSRAKKSSAGYDLTHLFVGAEGTLGVITSIDLRLHIIPSAVSAAVGAFPSVEEAIQCAMEAMQLGLNVARIEFLDSEQVRAINQFSKTDLPLMPMLFFEFHGTSDEDVSSQAAALQSIAEDHHCLGFQWKKTQEDRDALWKARHDAYYAAQSLLPGSKIWITDACVPISRLADCIRETREDLASASFQATIVGHVGDGNFHVMCVLNPNDEGQIEEASAFSGRIAQRAQSMGGTCSGEHGVGFGKLNYLSAEHGNGLDVMRAIKQALDPEDRMNPGKLIPSA